MRLPCRFLRQAAVHGINDFIRGICVIRGSIELSGLSRYRGNFRAFAVAVEEEDDEDDCEDAGADPHGVAEFADALGDVAAVGAAPIAEAHEYSTAEDGGEAVGDDEFGEFESAGAGGEDHGAADAHEEAADGDEPDSVFSEKIFGAFDAGEGDVFADEGDFYDFFAVEMAEGVEDAVAADDAEPGEGGGDGEMPLMFGDEDAGGDEGDVFGDGDSDAAGEEEAEEGAVAAGVEPAPHGMGLEKKGEWRALGESFWSKAYDESDVILVRCNTWTAERWQTD